MKSNKLHRHNYSLFVFTFCLVFSLFTFPIGDNEFLTLHAQSEIESEIEEKEEEKEDKEQDLEQSEILEDAFLEESMTVDEKIQALEEELASLEEVNEQKLKELEDLEDEKLEKQKDLDQRNEDLQRSSRELYKTSFVNVLEVVFTSQSTDGLMQRIGFLRYGMGGVVSQLKNLQEDYDQLKNEFSDLSDEVKEIEAELAASEEKKTALINQKKVYEIKAQEEAKRQDQLSQDITDLVSDIENLSQKAQETIDNKTGGGEAPGGGDGNPGGGGSPQDPTGDPGTYSIYKDGELVEASASGPIRFVPGNASYFSVDSGAGRYRGILEFRSDTNVFIINELDIELYLRGIGEMPSSWPDEALKSQATIARTYALANWNKRTSYGYNLRDDTYDQNYVGYGKETASYGDKWVSAVRSTENDVLYSGGNVIATYYHSTCGGHTLSSAQVWGGTRSFAQAQSDWYDSGGKLVSYDADSPWSYKRWCGKSYQNCTSNENINNAELEDLLNAAIYLSQNPDSQARQDEVHRQDWGGLSPAELEAKLGAGNRISDKIGNLSSVQSIYNGGSTNIQRNTYRTISIRARGDQGSVDIDADSFWLVFNVRAPGTAHIFYSNFWTVKKEGGSWNFYTRGYPHRVGLCQYGAKGRADAGQSYETILKHYYNGVSLGSHSPSSPIRIGLTQVGGATTYISSNGGFEVESNGQKIGQGGSGQSWKVVKN
jgi:SpoIID/LytB domain protein